MMKVTISALLMNMLLKRKKEKPKTEQYKFQQYSLCFKNFLIKARKARLG